MIQGHVNPYSKYIKRHDKDKYVKPEDVRSVISHCNEYAIKAKRSSYGVVENMFELGCIASRNNSNITRKDMARALRIGFKDLEFAITLANKFEKDRRQLDKFCEENNIGSWVTLKNRLNPAERQPSKAKTLYHQIREATNYIEKGGEDADKYKKILQSALNKIPLKKEIADKMHIKYHRCTACKDEPPPQGHNYIYNKKVESYVPICDRCIKDGVDPDPIEVARMYSTYAINMEAAFDKIYLRQDENGYDI